MCKCGQNHNTYIKTIRTLASAEPDPLLRLSCVATSPTLFSAPTTRRSRFDSSSRGSLCLFQCLVCFTAHFHTWPPAGATSLPAVFHWYVLTFFEEPKPIPHRDFVQAISIYLTSLTFCSMKGDQRPLILGVSVALSTISVLAVLLQFESRRVKRVQLGADDWTILAALVRHSTFLLSSILAHTETVQLHTIGATLDVLLGESR